MATDGVVGVALWQEIVMRGIVLLILCILSIGASPVYADSFRCGSYLAQEGMPSPELTKRCGEPDVVKTSEEPIIVRRPNGTSFENGVTITHLWYYERGPNQFVARVTIRDDAVQKIELLSARLLDDLELSSD